MILDDDGPGARAAAAVRGAEGLVHVQMDDVEAHVAEASAAEEGVEISAVAVEEVVLVGIDCLVQSPGVAALVSRAVVGDREEPFALEPALGVEGDPSVLGELALAALGAEVLHVSLHCVVAQRPFGKADHDPVADLRRDPGAHLLLACGQREPQGRVSGLRCGRKFDEGYPVLAHPIIEIVGP